MDITIIKATTYNGVSLQPGQSARIPDVDAQTLIATRYAIPSNQVVDKDVHVVAAAANAGLTQVATDPAGNTTGIAGPNGSVLYGSLTSGAWMKVPTIFRLRLTGTGTCVVDSRNRLGVVSTGIASYSPSGATNEIEYPYPGDDAVEIRVTLTGTCQAEVL